MKNSKILGGGEGDAYGSIYSFTLYWQFVRATIYNSPIFLILLKAAIAGVNVWYFFIRGNYFIECLYQLANTFKNKKKLMTLTRQR